MAYSRTYAYCMRPAAGGGDTSVAFQGTVQKNSNSQQLAYIGWLQPTTDSHTKSILMVS